MQPLQSILNGGEMEHIKIDKEWYIALDWHDYIASNLAKNGCAIFYAKNDGFDFKGLERDLKAKDEALKDIFVFSFGVYDKRAKELETFWAFVNGGELSPFSFFDMLRLSCAKAGLEKFFACDLKTEKIYEMSPTSTFVYGNLSDMKKLLGLDNNRHIVGKWIKWIGCLGYTRYFSAPRVFRNEVEKEYFSRYGQFLTQYCKKPPKIDVFYTFDECKIKIDKSGVLNFSNMTILEFDLDDPNLCISATVIKARNLNIKSINAKEVFCEHLECATIEANNICAESISCAHLIANTIKTNFSHGVKFKAKK